MRNSSFSCSHDIKEVSPILIDYLKSRNPSNCEAVVMNGGEPLFYFGLIKELFSYVPFNVHKKIITNGTLLTQDIVDYVNSNRIELCISHDGEKTSYLRGVDVLLDNNILSFINQVNDLCFSCTITSLNCNVLDNYNYISRFVSRDFHFLVNVVLETDFNSYLVNNFDYDLFERSLLECHLVRSYYSPHYSSGVNEGRNILLNGDIVLLDSLYVIGNVLEPSDVILSRLNLLHSNCSSCQDILSCRMPKHLACKHLCRKEKCVIAVSDYINLLKDGYL